MIKVLVSSAAEADFTEALCWYAERSRQAAEKFEAEFEKALATIAAAPHRFPKCDQRHQYYIMGRFSFHIVYRVDGEQVVVIAVAHGSRRPGYWSSR